MTKSIAKQIAKKNEDRHENVMTPLNISHNTN